MNLVKKVQENISRHGLFSRGDKIIIGVSGGPDSVCLLDILDKLKNKYKLKIIIAHVNYGLRGEDSNKEEELVKKLAKKYSYPIEILKNKTRKGSKISEDSLRKIRYNFFERLRKKYKANFIAVAHHRNDQAETVLMRILRGTGLRGLRAIRFSSNKIIRPLLNISREEILAYLRQNKIPYHLDKTNFGFDFTRNKIRNSLLPFIEKNFNPRIQETLYKISQSTADDYDFINRYGKVWLAANKNLQISALNRLHPSIRREVLRQAIEKIKPNLPDIESAHIDEILKLLKSTKNKQQKITFKGLKIERRGDKLVIKKHKK